MDRKQWNQYILQHAPPFGAFLQSWEWGMFQRSIGRKVERIFSEAKGGVVVGQAIKMDLPLGQYYWFFPKGPLGTLPIADMIGRVRSELPDGVFLRFEPAETSKMLKVNDVHPSTSLVVDLTRSSEDLLAQMKSKTRYNARLAQRKGVTCKTVGLEYFDDFVRLLEQTSVRDKIRSHPKTYYRALLESMQEGDARAFLAMAFYEGRPLAANIMIDFGGQRTYVHGATSNLHRNVMAQYGLHWYLMQDAKERGMTTFDFYGIAPEGADETHPWFGITRYKKGFGGSVVQTPGTFELQTKHVWYGMYRTVKRLRRLK